MAGLQVVPNEPALSPGIVITELTNMNRQAEEQRRSQRTQEFSGRMQTARTREDAFRALNEYPDLVSEPETLRAVTGMIDHMYPDHTKDTFTNVTAYTADGTKSKTLPLPHSTLSLMGSPTAVQQLFGPEYTLVKSQDDASNMMNYYEQAGPAPAPDVAPSYKLKGRFLIGSAPEGLIPESETKKAEEQADNLARRRSTEAIEARNALLENIALKGATREQSRDAASDIGKMQETIDRLIKDDKFFAVLRGEEIQALRAATTLEANKLYNAGLSWEIAATQAFVQLKYEDKIKNLKPGERPPEPPTSNPPGSLFNPPQYPGMFQKVPKPSAAPAEMKPAAKPAATQKWPAPKPEDVEFLKKNPGKRELFEKKFGPGSAKRYLGK